MRISENVLGNLKERDWEFKDVEGNFREREWEFEGTLIGI